ncbi:type II toxin-antitoxin system RelE/ParE family toxin [Nitrincola sp.]|uniref:type II toxin-antitoxin system RelE/ParE family toxin n=1 Tax=Nitrincola sp. TaxID=1926584 RepID=UPI003A8DBBEF
MSTQGLESFYTARKSRSIQTAHAVKLRGVLALLNVAVTSADLNIPFFKPLPLNGELNGHWSIWVNGNWRVAFQFIGVDVELG